MGAAGLSTSHVDSWVVEEEAGALARGYGICWMEEPPAGARRPSSWWSPATAARGSARAPARPVRGPRGRARPRLPATTGRQCWPSPRTRATRAGGGDCWEAGAAGTGGSAPIWLEGDLDGSQAVRAGRPASWPPRSARASTTPRSTPPIGGVRRSRRARRDSLEEWLGSRLARGGPALGLWLVAWDGSEVVGGVEAVETPRGGYMGELFVRPRWRGCGVGAR